MDDDATCLADLMAKHAPAPTMAEYNAARRECLTAQIEKYGLRDEFTQVFIRAQTLQVLIDLLDEVTAVRDALTANGVIK